MSDQLINYLKEKIELSNADEEKIIAVTTWELQIMPLLDFVVDKTSRQQLTSCDIGV